MLMLMLMIRLSRYNHRRVRHPHDGCLDRRFCAGVQGVRGVFLGALQTPHDLAVERPRGQLGRVSPRSPSLGTPALEAEGGGSFRLQNPAREPADRSADRAQRRRQIGRGGGDGDGCADLGGMCFFCAATRRANAGGPRTVRLGVTPNAASAGV